MKDYLRSFFEMLGLLAVILASIAASIGTMLALVLLIPMPWGAVAALAWACVSVAALFAAAERMA